MRIPPAELLRDEPPPDDLLLVVRGGTTTLSDAHLANQVGDCWERHQFFGVSVFGAPDDDLVALSGAVRAIRIRPVIRLARCVELRSAGFEVMPTFPNPRHFSVVLPDGTPATFESLRTCFGDVLTNPGYVAEA
ncbi:MAG: hypothetical protein M3159_03315 [Actinomycetota bacterium]|nr:hypothetical protein [Actinomycetota bacterium]